MTIAGLHITGLWLLVIGVVFLLAVMTLAYFQAAAERDRLLKQLHHHRPE